MEAGLGLLSGHLLVLLLGPQIYISGGQDTVQVIPQTHNTQPSWGESFRQSWQGLTEWKTQQLWGERRQSRPSVLLGMIFFFNWKKHLEDKKKRNTYKLDTNLIWIPAAWPPPTCLQCHSNGAFLKPLVILRRCEAGIRASLEAFSSCWMWRRWPNAHIGFRIQGDFQRTRQAWCEEKAHQHLKARCGENEQRSHQPLPANHVLFSKWPPSNDMLNL